MTKQSAKRGSSANYGIIGDVKARAVAVGEGAHATSNQTVRSKAREDLDAALKQLQDQISKLSLPLAGNEALKDDLEKLKELGTEKTPAPGQAASVLESVIGKLKMIGVLVESVKPLRDPIKAIAAFYGIPLPF